MGSIVSLSQGGVEVPTGGNPSMDGKPASAPVISGGQQIRCETGADGHSPDGRENGRRSLGVDGFGRALIHAPFPRRTT